MPARRACVEIYGRAAIRTINHPEVFSQLRDLRWRKRADEILLAKEFEEPDEPAMVVIAAEVAESRVPLHILSGP